MTSLISPKIGFSKGRVTVTGNFRKFTSKNRAYGEKYVKLSCECGVSYDSSLTDFTSNDSPHCGCARYKDMHKLVEYHLKYASSLNLEHNHSPYECKTCSRSGKCAAVFDNETQKVGWLHGAGCILDPFRKVRSPYRGSATSI